MKRILSLLILLAIGTMITTGIKAQTIAGTYAIQNIQTGKNLRPYEAGKADGNRLVLYNHHKWKCMTWQFIHTEGETYQLKNLYTGKSFQSSTNPESGVSLWQQPVKKNNQQNWEFIEQPDKTYLIKLKDTDLYITISSENNNSDIILMQKNDSGTQRWKLVKQNPFF